MDQNPETCFLDEILRLIGARHSFRPGPVEGFDTEINDVDVIARWWPAPLAYSYDLFLDGVPVGGTNGGVFVFADPGAGTHEIGIKAVGAGFVSEMVTTQVTLNGDDSEPEAEPTPEPTPDPEPPSPVEGHYRCDPDQARILTPAGEVFKGNGANVAVNRVPIGWVFEGAVAPEGQGPPDFDRGGPINEVFKEWPQDTFGPRYEEMKEWGWNIVRINNPIPNSVDARTTLDALTTDIIEPLREVLAAGFVVVFCSMINDHRRNTGVTLESETHDLAVEWWDTVLTKIEEAGLKNHSRLWWNFQNEPTLRYDAEARGEWLRLHDFWWDYAQQHDLKQPILMDCYGYGQHIEGYANGDFDAWFAVPGRKEQIVLSPHVYGAFRDMSSYGPDSEDAQVEDQAAMWEQIQARGITLAIGEYGSTVDPARAVPSIPLGVALNQQGLRTVREHAYRLGIPTLFWHACGDTIRKRYFHVGAEPEQAFWEPEVMGDENSGNRSELGNTVWALGRNDLTPIPGA